MASVLGTLYADMEEEEKIYTNKFVAKIILPKKVGVLQLSLFLTKLPKGPKDPKSAKRPKSNIKLQNVPKKMTLKSSKLP